MKTNIATINGFAALALALGSGLAVAQTATSTCMSFGPNVPEPIGDREAHAIQVAAASCTTEGGPLDGAVMTQNTIWEIDKGTMNILSADGVSRKPGTVAAYRVTAGTLNWVIQDGKPVGWTAAGKGVYTLTSGSAASLAGKTFSWTGRATGPRTYVIEAKID
jgi:hypothetical protein